MKFDKFMYKKAFVKILNVTASEYFAILSSLTEELFSLNYLSYIIYVHRSSHCKKNADIFEIAVMTAEKFGSVCI